MPRNATEILAAIAAMPPGTVVSVAASVGRFTVTFSTPPAPNARRIFSDRATNADLETALSDGIDAAMVRIGGNQ